MKPQSKYSAPDFDAIVLLIQQARGRAFSKVNAELVLLYFSVGKVVAEKVANGVWGEGTVDELALFIEKNIAGIKGFNRRGLYRMKQFYDTYNVGSDCFKTWNELQQPIVSAMRTQLNEEEKDETKFVSAVLAQISWTNHRLIISKTKSAEEKLFYLFSCINDKLSTRELERQLNTAVFERNMLARQTSALLPQGLPENIFKDPYIFEFLDLPDTHSENELEKALIKNLQLFILEIGKGFSYMGNQYRLQVGNKDYHTDLLFYNRDLQCLVLFELKIEEFQPEFLGKLNFYLEALDRDIKKPNENPSIGILLCKGKDTEVVEYAMARNTSPAIIADYETKLIDKKVLANKLHQLMEQLSKKEIE
jgi:predicted nuclease of restriction endonuclease-like (RecB) superfamily